MYLIVGLCFTFAASNDLIISPKYNKLKEKHKQYAYQDEYIEMNGDKDGTE